MSKKGCLLLQRKFAPIGHEIAKNLLAQGVDEFCAVVHLRTAFDFLKSQTDIKYTSLLLDEDIYKQIASEIVDIEYLEKLEKDYGIPNLWPYLCIDRVLMHQQLIREYPYDKPLLSHEDLLRAVQVYSKAIIKFLDTEKPDFVFMSVIASLGSSLLYFIAKKKGIPTLNLDSTRIGNGNIISLDFRNFTWADKLFRDIQNGSRQNTKKTEAEKYLKGFREHPAPYFSEYAPSMRPIARSRQLKFLLPSNLFKSVKWTFLSALRYFAQEQKDYTDEIPYLALWDRLKRKLRGLWGYRDLYQKPNLDVDFAFLGLHMDPETATLLYAPHYTNQQELIRQTASALPVGTKLYVKEHPFMVNYRPRAYYQEILKMPNVVLIDPSINAYDLVRRARLIITISGTSAWEATLLGKPAITFGEVFFNSLSMVKRCKSFEDLPYLVKEQIENFHYNEPELINFIGAILAESVDVDLIALWEKADQGENIKQNEGLKSLAGLIAKKLELVGKKA